MYKTLWILPLLLVSTEAMGSDRSDEEAKATEEVTTEIRPFQAGESLEYEIRLLGILAATADLGLGDGSRDRLRIQANARTVGASDSVFRMRSQASCTVGEDLDPALCRSTSESRGKVQRREIRFDKSEGVVLERKVEKGAVDSNRIELEPGFDGVQDTLSGLYLIRAHLPAKGEVLKFRSIVRGKPAIVEAETSGIETMETPMGTFQVAVVDVRLPGKHDEETTSHARLWITTDESRLPLRATTKAPIGTMEATLVGAKGTKNGALAFSSP